MFFLQIVLQSRTSFLKNIEKRYFSALKNTLLLESVRSLLHQATEQVASRQDKTLVVALLLVATVHKIRYIYYIIQQIKFSTYHYNRRWNGTNIFLRNLLYLNRETTFIKYKSPFSFLYIYLAIYSIFDEFRSIKHIFTSL